VARGLQKCSTMSALSHPLPPRQAAPLPGADHALWQRLAVRALQFQQELPDARVQWHLDVAAGLAAPSEAMAEALASIFDQLLDNIVRHAHPTEVALRVSAHASDLTLVVKDNGRGAPPSAFDRFDAHGVLDMRRRAAQFGGWLHIDSQMGVGTQVILTLPLYQHRSAL
jgi:signal transduction histidine kinase